MKESLRRPLLFLITIGAGSLIIAFDATVEVIIAGTVLTGFLALIITGALDPAELRPSRLAAALRDRGEKKREATEADTPAGKPSLIRRLATTEINLSGMLGTLGASVRETIAHARAPEGEKKNRIEQLDLMLDQAVDGTAPDPSITPGPSKAGRGAVDPLASLADLDLDSLEGLDFGGEGSGPAAFEPDQLTLLSGEDEDAVSAILKTHQSDLDDLDLTSGLELTGEPGVTPPLMTAGAPELPGGAGIPDMSALSAELSALDDLDPGEIEIEGEEVDTDEPVPEEEDPLEEEPEEEEFDMVSFASGGTIDDDLITALKSDAKKKKFVEDVSLVRELKGERYAAEDIAAELEEILAAMKAAQ